MPVLSRLRRWFAQRWRAQDAPPRTVRVQNRLVAYVGPPAEGARVQQVLQELNAHGINTWALFAPAVAYRLAGSAARTAPAAAGETGAARAIDGSGQLNGLASSNSRGGRNGLNGLSRLNGVKGLSGLGDSNEPAEIGDLGNLPDVANGPQLPPQAQAVLRAIRERRRTLEVLAAEFGFETTVRAVAELYRRKLIQLDRTDPPARPAGSTGTDWPDWPGQQGQQGQQGQLGPPTALGEPAEPAEPGALPAWSREADLSRPQ